MTIRHATLDDAVALADLGVRTFVDAFGAFNRAVDMEVYLSRTYTPSRQLAEIDDRDIATLVADADGALTAFAQLRRGGHCPPCITGEAPVELARFYVDRAWHGQGLAQSLMHAVDDAARAFGGATLWLGVWERNARAIAFYRKCGFVDAGTQPFILGTDLQTDRVMTRALGGGS